MSRLIALAFVLLAAGPAFADWRTPSRPLGGPVQVDGYTRQDGTYVQPYQRTAPDRSSFNNYEMPGNYNPNTYQITPGSPQRYLDRYERERGR
jgi:hypothetical protein